MMMQKVNSRTVESALAMKFRSYGLTEMLKLPQLQSLGKERLFAMKVVGQVLPFKANNHVVENLIRWEDPDDPIFNLTFPQPGMLRQEHYTPMAKALLAGDERNIRETAREIRNCLNPNPAGQKDLNIPRLADGTPLEGMQHKYRQTILFFPRQGQTCHAYCSFCFRWPQFAAVNDQKFASKECDQLVQYVREQSEITDVLFTGGDPLVMGAKVFKTYIEALLKANIPHLQTIRIGTKALSYWPYRFTGDPDTGELLETLASIPKHGKHLAIMAHVNHPNEIKHKASRRAVENLRNLGAEIRSQSPLMRHINDSSQVWSRMWKQQIRMGIIPYYLFLARDTGAQHHFAVPLVRAWEIYSKAARQISGLGRTVRGPSMSCGPGKIEITGVTRMGSNKLLALRMLQGRDPEWAFRPFFAQYDPKAIWLDDLKPAFGEERFFFESESPVEEGDSNAENPWISAEAA